jgi:hypothetical protein
MDGKCDLDSTFVRRGYGAEAEERPLLPFGNAVDAKQQISADSAARYDRASLKAAFQKVRRKQHGLLMFILLT